MNQTPQLIRRSYQFDWRNFAFYRYDVYAPVVHESSVSYGSTSTCLFNLRAILSLLNPFKSHGNR